MSSDSTFSPKTSVQSAIPWIVSVATAVLIVTAILGPVLTVMTVSGITVSVFRLYLPLYGLALAVAVATHRLSFKSLISAVPIPAWLLIGIGIYAVASAPFYTDFHRLLFELFTLLSALFTGTMLIVTVDSRPAIERYLVVLLALVVCAELISFWEMFFKTHLPISRLVGSDRATAWFENPNNLSFFFALSVGPLAAYSLIPDPNRSVAERGCYAIVGAIAVFIIWWNTSRIALVSAILVGMVVVGIIVSRSRFRPIRTTRRDRLAIVGVVLLIVLVLILIFLTIPTPFPRAEGSLWKRWRLSRAGAEVFVHTLGIGAGVGNVNNVIQSGAVTTQQGGTLHNWMFYFAAAYGVAGIGLFVGAYGSILFDLGVKAINSTEPVNVGLFGTLLVFPLCALGPSNAAMTYSFWILLFLAIGAAYRLDNYSVCSHS